jgi:streptogramin lyase
MKNKYILIILILSIFCYLPSSSQIVSFVKYGVENGMAQSQVQNIVQDAQGRIWVGTISGVSIFDGVNFSNYNTKRGFNNSPNGLAEDWVTASFRDSQGDIWLGHWGGSITKFDNKTQQFENIEIEKFNEFQTITCIIESDPGEIIFASNGSGLFLYDVPNKKVHKIEFSKEPGSKFIKSLFLDSQKNLWVSTEGSGVFIFEESNLLGDSIKAAQIDVSNGLSENDIISVIEFNNSYWIGTANQGINVIKRQDLIKYLKNDNTNLGVKYYTNKNGLSSNYITSMMLDNRNELWIGTNDRGIVKAIKNDDKVIFKNYNVKQGLSFYDINTIYQDRENSVWIGTDVGLNQYISDYFLLYDESIGIPNNIVWSMAQDNTGDIWVGTNLGVSQLKNANSKTNSDSIKVSNFNIPGLANTPVQCIFKDSDGDVWFGTGTGKLFKRSVDGKFERINIETVIQDVIYSIGEDKDGNIWIGTRIGAAKLNRKTNKLIVYTDKDKLGGNNVYKIHKDKKGMLWFAILGGNLTSYDGEKFKTYGEKEGLKSQFVLSIGEDSKGNLWFGTYAGGLYKYDGKSFTNFNKDNGMSSETPYAIVADPDDNIWLGTSYGIEKYDQSKNTFSHYGKNEGFLGVEVNPNSILRDNNDNIWFGTILGAVKYNPSVDFGSDVKPIVLIPNLLINLEESEFPFNNEFRPEENHIIFNFVGVSLNNSNKVRYVYKLDGLDNKWSDLKADRQASFTNLDPGKYKFIVKAYNSYGIESEEASYNFTIVTPFYQSYWFYAIQVFIVGIMLVLAVYFGRKTGGSRLATVLASIAIIIVFEYFINYVEDNLEDRIGSIAFIKVGLNALLGLILFPVEKIIKERLIAGKANT